MKKISSNKSNKENRPPVEPLNLATIAAQMMEDIEHIYAQADQQPMRTTKKTEFHVSSQSSNDVNSWLHKMTTKIRSYPILCNILSIRRSAAGNQFSTLPIPKNCDLFVLATRSKDLRTEIQIRLALQIAITLKQPIILFSASDSFIQFTRKLVGHMADIPSDAEIYDGKLNENELHRLRAALTQLMAAKVLTYPMQMFGLDEVCNAPRKIHRQIGEIGLVLVDAVQFLTDNQRRCVDVKTSLIELKALADELKVPVIALYQLEPTDGNHPSTLTRYELGEIEVLNELTDGFLLMSGTREELVFATPKIHKAKPVK
jgi:hypothetical protein